MLARSGCTTSTDHHYVFPRGAGDLLAAEIDAAASVGLRFHPCRGSMDLGRSSGGLPPDEVVEDRDVILAATEAAIDRWHDPSPESMLRIAVAPCSPFSVTGELMGESAELARRHGVRLHTHLAETREEEAFCLERYGVRPVEYLDDLGWIGPDVWLAHCVHLSRDEIDRLAATGTAWRTARAPTRGWAPASRRSTDLVGAGGRGGAGSRRRRIATRAGELAGELRQALLVARLRGGPEAMTARRALELGTIHGARCLGREAEIGSLEAGKLADVALWRLDDVDHAGIADPVAALVLGAPPRVETLLVGGRAVVEGGRPVGCDDDEVARAWPSRAPGWRREHHAHPDPRGIGQSVRRTDGVPKVTGRFAYSSDLQADGMLWGATLRSPHPSARVRGIEIAPALAVPGVRAVLTHEDVPGPQGLRDGGRRPAGPGLGRGALPGRAGGDRGGRRARDGPARGRAGSRSTTSPCRRWPTPRPPCGPGPAPCTRAATCCATSRSATATAGRRRRRGARRLRGGDAGPGLPGAGVRPRRARRGRRRSTCYLATQWLHVDQGQVAASLGLPPERTRLHLAGVGGAFGGREDLSMQVHVCDAGAPHRAPGEDGLLARGVVLRPRPSPPGPHELRARGDPGRAPGLRAGPARARRRGLRLQLDGRHRQRGVLLVRALRRAERHHRRVLLYTNNPPCGAMRGFGVVQVAFAHESQMDRLAGALGMDPVELRVRNALQTGMPIITGQEVNGPAPVRELLDRLRAMPLPPAAASDPPDPRERPGGVSNVTRGEGVRRGVGYAVGYKNIAFAEGFDDYSTARVRLSLAGGAPLCEVHTAAAEVGQGLITVQEQIARTELGVERVVVLPADTTVGSAGSSSASRQTWMTGGAVRAACAAVRERLAERGEGPLEDLLAVGPVEETRVYRHRPTRALDPETGQGDSHVAFAFAAHRAVCDVDTELGLVRVVEIATTQDVGRVINPQAVEGQIQGGIAQGLGLALMEEIRMGDGRVLNASFTDYLLPTSLDMPPVRMEILETPHPRRPLRPERRRGAADHRLHAGHRRRLRDATGRPLPRVPLRPDDIVGG